MIDGYAIRDSMLRIPSEFVSEGALSEMRVPNINYGKFYGEPEFHNLYYEENGFLVLPRNFPAWRHFPGMPINDQTVPGKDVVFPDLLLTPRNYQVTAINTLFDYFVDQILVSPCGSGKTVMGNMVISKYGKKSAVFVSTEQLLEQWLDRIYSGLGVQAGTYSGSRKKTDGDIVIFSIQSLYDSYISPSYCDEFGLLVFDECHEAGALEWNRALRHFKGAVRLGLSATPKRKDGLDTLMVWSLGDISHEVERDSLLDAGDVLTPDILYVAVDYPETIVQKKPRFRQRVVTDSNKDYAKTFEQMFGVSFSEAKEVTPAEDDIDLTNTQTAIAEHPERNDMIVSLTRKCLQNGRKILIVCNRRSAIDTLYEKLSEMRVDVAILDGRTKKNNYNDVYKAKVIIGMLGVVKRGLDIPELDTAILTCAVSDKGLIEQLLGRISRPFPGKKKPLLIDILDKAHKCFLFMRNSRKVVYKKLGCHIRNAT